jgi:SAM-dependent methyltransferase
MSGYDYFDATYFNDGPSKGTVYANYVESSRSSAIYREIASAIASVLKPKRVLEIGCATGLIVRLLNEAGIEAHGIDVSEWAIANREHRNVIRAGAEDLPYKDRHFDAVFSVHALEHVPAHLAEAAFGELHRVCPVGPQWHMLPVIGLGPYVGSRETVVAGLQKDPTHNLLEDEEWWLKQFAAVGLQDSGHAIYLRHERNTFDLSHSQFLVAGGPLDLGLAKRLRAWNAGVLGAHYAGSKHNSLLRLDNGWDDLSFGVPETDYHDDLLIGLDVLSSAAIPLRVAALGGGKVSLVSDHWFEVSAGLSRHELRLSDFTIRQGDAERASVSQLLVGGPGPGTISLNISVQCEGQEIFRA